MNGHAKTCAIFLSVIALFAMATAPKIVASPASGVLPVGPLVGDQDLSPFYRWVGDLPAQPGLMLREEPLPGQPDIVDAASAVRILYTSTDVRWHSGIIPVSGTLYLPKGTPPEGGWPLVAWAHGTLGVADSCAPSWTGQPPRDAAYINSWLKHGFAVVATDYQGLGGPGPHPYLFWQAEGLSVLDAIRAALAADKGKIANVVIISGQSQGSGAALGATRLAPDYAPEVKLRASIATGLVSTVPGGPSRALPGAPRDDAPAYRVIMAMVGGGLRDGSGSPDALVTDKGREVLAAARTQCLAQIRRIDAQDHVTIENAFKSPAEIPALMLQSTDMTPVKMPVPVFLGTGLADTTLPARRQFKVVAALCAAGSDIVWKTYPGVTHDGGVNAALPDELSFVHGMLHGIPEPGNCATIKEPGEPEKPAPGIPFND